MSALERHQQTRLSRDLERELEAVDRAALVRAHTTGRELQLRQKATEAAMYSVTEVYREGRMLIGDDPNLARLLAPMIEGFARDAYRISRGQR